MPYINEYTTQEKALIIQMCEAGCTWGELAKALNRSKSGIINFAFRNCIVKNSKPRKTSGYLGKEKKPRFHGCTEDCFNCPYPDCLKPSTAMSSLKLKEE